MADPSVKSPASLIVNKLNRGKKRKVKYEEWKQVKNKRLKDSGLAYMGSKGVAKPAKKPANADDLCSATCTYDGCSLLNENNAQELFLFNIFYGDSYNEQQQFLSECFDIRDPQRRSLPANVSTRQSTVKYTLPTSSRSSKLQMAAAQTEEDLTKLEVDSEVHHRKAEKGYNILSSDTQVSKENANMIVLCVDLQQFPVHLEQWYEEKEGEKVLRKIFGSERDEVTGEEEKKTYPNIT
ncbi:hypothetical protein ANN_04439 [Periplaneta americana]|uniref:Uncharacterized protein n=1 Tax=Periplaneta americana TaxID=6978 RepID=A0ABQ8TA42_PERAM|nr:hypothetical protein ANN_04439 [Periplaneta americana]